jgi:hypothetical protein
MGCTGFCEARERMAHSVNTFLPGFQVTWHVVHMMIISMRADGRSSSATFTLHHSISTQGTVSQHAAILHALQNQ